MIDLAGRLGALSPDQRAQLTARLAAQAPEPGAIAVLGIGCRFPGGANSLEAFWRALRDGVDAVRTAPPERWDGDAKARPLWGAFLDQVDLFDAEFFGLSPREANYMDPQQRLLLETAFEALEDAGQLTERLSGSAAGVFIGAHSHSSDYYLMQARSGEAPDTYTATGSAHSILANRLSFVLNLRGPSLAVDTACSSSLVALHLACQSLRTRETDLAVAGGVNVMLTPDYHACLGKLDMLAPDGRCKTFDDRADGFVRGEGCGVVVLKRLADAVRGGDPIAAVILGSAVNQDGSSNGLTAPSGGAQQSVILGALKMAQVSPAQVSYIETHGTGTALGDPIEVEALAAALGTGRECCLGALKTNIGHLEAASGIAGFIKAVLCLKHGAIPGNLHFETLNPHIALAGSRFVIPDGLRPWPRAAEARVAGVSSFGFGGTNAHVVLSDAPESNGANSVEMPKAMLPLTISARSASALRELAAAYIEFLTTGPGTMLAAADISYTSGRRRLHHEHRWTVSGSGPAEWAAALQGMLAGSVAEQGTPALEFPAHGVCVPLPRYPWQRRRYWLPSLKSPRIANAPADWFYEIEWPEVRAAASAPRTAETFLVFGESALAHELKKRIETRGDVCHLAGAVTLSGFTPGKVIYLADETSGDLVDACQRPLDAVRALLAAGNPPQVWFVTRGGQDVGGISDPAGALMWGLGRGVALEAPELQLRLIDLDPAQNNADAAEALLAEVDGADIEDQIALRAGRRHAARLKRAIGFESGPQVPLRVTGAHLVTGALGALGSRLALRLAAAGASHLVLVVSRPLPARAAWDAIPAEDPDFTRVAMVRAIEAAGATVTIAAIDLSDDAAIQSWFATQETGPLNGVWHTAMSFSSAPLRELDAAQVRAMIRVKAAAAWQLHELTRAHPLKYFVVFSSTTALWGATGLAHYAAANTFLEALAHSRRAAGLPGTVINWGIWSETRGRSAVERDRAQRAGMRPLRAAAALAGMEMALARGLCQTVIADIDWPVFKPVYESHRQRPFLNQIALPKGTPEPNASPFLEELSAAPADERRELLARRVHDILASVLGVPEGGLIDRARGFFDLGMDSLTSVQLRTQLQGELRRALPTTLIFNYSTIDLLADYLAAELFSTRPEPAPIRATDQAASPLRPAGPVNSDAIAIVGIGCRYPGGVTGPESFWDLLCSGKDAVTEVPAARWAISDWYDADRAVPGKASTRWGGFLDGIDQFDAHFFGIAPREAAMLDPQHRILLEVAWEALEHAAQPFASLAGSRTGVFVGVTNNEYYQHLLRTLPASDLSPYAATGNVMNAAAGRLAFHLGVHGPSVAVDTACSSSLTAIHLACQGLRSGDCRMALAGGVNVIVIPETSVMFSKWGMMAADGRCKAFDAAADGFVRSEGCGVVVLKRLADALADGDRVLAVIEGSAVNQDGRSSGLTVPNGAAQQALIRQALASAGVEPGQIDYVEAHGTGTSLGDPIEVDALAAVFGPGRNASHKLRIGSVKTNLGHTESASGVAGLIKCALALGHGQIPAQLHFKRPTPEIPWDKIPIEVAATHVPWPRRETLRRAGVSSFGFSGANAHVILCEAPEAAALPVSPVRPRHILAFSAHDAEALSEAASRHAAALRNGANPLPDYCFSANSGRAHFRHRAAVHGESSAGLVEALAHFSPAKISGEPPRVAFLFTGQGSQYAGMGRQLYDTQPVFRAEMDHCAELLAPHLDRPLIDLVFATTGRAAELDQTRNTQPALFALEWSLAQLWRSWGIEPTAVLGHSVGEYVAACQAGAMSLEDGIALISARAGLMQALPPGGVMAAVAAGEEAVRECLAPGVSIAAVNGPRNIVISGGEGAVTRVLTALKARRISSVPLPVSHAFHSELLDPMLDEFERAAARVAYRSPAIPFISNLTGSQLAGPINAAYWRQHARGTVRFADGIRELRRKGCEVFLEIGPSPILLNMARQCVGEGTQSWLPSLAEGRDEWTQILESLSQLYTRGANVDWSAFDRGYVRRRVALPTYPFQRKRHWIDAARPLIERAPASPLVKDALFTGTASVESLPWLADHIVGGRVIFPMTGYIEMAFEAGHELFGTTSLAIDDLVLHEPLAVEKSIEVQLVASQIEEAWGFRIISVRADGWTLHATGVVGHLEATSVPLDISVSDSGLPRMDAAEHYRVFAGYGIDFGPSFRGVASVLRGNQSATGEIRQPASAGSGRYVFHPAHFDACLQPLIHAWSAGAFLPFSVERIELHGEPSEEMTSRCRARDGAALAGDAVIYNSEGRVAAMIHGLAARPRMDEIPPIYEIEWSQIPSAATESAYPSPTAVSSRAAENRHAYLECADAAGYASLAGLLDARALEYTCAALRALGWHSRPGESAASLGRRLGVLPRYERLLARLAEIHAAPTPSVDPGVNAADSPELVLLDHCGPRLADVLRGECDPLELLFGPGLTETLQKIYTDSPSTIAVNRLATDVLSGIAACLPDERKLRVLEIGAGTGGTTRHVLEQLPADRTEYWFTDVAPALVGRARSQFGRYPFVRFEILDIEQEIESGPFAGREFDVVIAANVLHATADLRAAIRRARSLLAPGGLLVLIEGTRAQSWIDLTFGLTEGWWKFNDPELRPDYPLLDTAGWLRLLKTEGFAAPVELAGPAAGDRASDFTVFVAAKDSSANGATEPWLIFTDAAGAGEQLAGEIRSQGRTCMTVRPGAAFAQNGDEFLINPLHRPDYDRLFGATKFSGVAHFWSLNAAKPGTAPSGDLMKDQDWSCRSLLCLGQSLAASGCPLPGGTWLFTRGSQPVAGDIEALELAQATAWGFAKVLALEHPELQIRRVDLDPKGGIGEAQQIARILLGQPGETQLAIRNGNSHAPRLVKEVSASESQTLVAARPGELDSLEWRTSARREPAEGEIEIQVEATGLNFHDVLYALGMIPGDGEPLGGEAVGKVIAIGPGVSGLALGDTVAVFSHGGFSSRLTMSADLTFRKPDAWTVSEIATIPVAFATAYHSLVELGRIQRGERVLIHTATGGVGLAAVQLAQRAGCDIIATAGTPEKRDYLRSLGVEHVFDSRSVSFAEEIRKILPRGAGIDLVLNTLSGDTIEASLSLLSMRGRFIELGKRGIWDASRVAGMRPEAGYFIVDLAALSRESPASFRPIFAAISAAIKEGAIRPLPAAIFPREAAQEAFRHMAQARHIGKIIVGGCGNVVAVPGPFAARPGATYLVTGGLSGLGLRTAEWLAERGAMHLALMGRGQPGVAALASIDAMRRSGAQVLVCQGDVAQLKDVNRVFAEMEAALPPLRGVIHSAGLLADGAILQQDWARFESVFLPKVAGSWNLHLATLKLPLDFFACYSSASAVLGSRGQANHAAANAFLDALAHHRRAFGLPGLSINWGAWSGIGAAASESVLGRVADYGVRPINPGAGIAALEHLLMAGLAQAAVVPVNWARFAATLPEAERGFFAKLLPASVSRNSIPAAVQPPSPDARIESADPRERRTIIQSTVRDTVTAVLGLEPGFNLDPLQGFSDLGFDSLTSIEFRNRLQTRMGRALPATLAFDYPTVTALVNYFCNDPAESPDPDLPDLSQLTDAETEQLLVEELAKTRTVL